jgi:hypothetical protein
MTSFGAQLSAERMPSQIHEGAMPSKLTDRNAALHRRGLDGRKASDRLACYDRAAPPKAAGKPAASKVSAVPAKPVASNAPSDQGQVVDMLAVENSKLDSKLKTICRGC